jgi:hypothetical protein
MTMPHLMNCDHLDSGWCLDCVKKLQDGWEERFNDAIANARFQHNDAECKAVGELLEYLRQWPQKTEHNDLGLEGKLEVYWNDCVMGTIEDDGDGAFYYYPLAFGQRGQNEQGRKNI